jgi:outer membrane murein-binding lipoprotein Lpp
MLNQSIILALVVFTLAAVFTMGGMLIIMQDKINQLLATVQDTATKFAALEAAWQAYKTANPAADLSGLESAITALNGAVTNSPAP